MQEFILKKLWIYPDTCRLYFSRLKLVVNVLKGFLVIVIFFIEK